VTHNPYAAPGEQPPYPDATSSFGAPEPWTASEVLSIAWARFKVHGGILVVAYLPSMFIAGTFGQMPNILTWTRALDPGSTAFFATSGGALVVNLAISSFFQAGYCRMWLDAARGIPPRFETAFSGADRLLPMFGLYLLFALGITLGCVLLVVPAVLLGLIFQIAPYYVVAGNLGPLDAIGRSWSNTVGQKGELFVLALAGFGLMILGTFMCCIGWIFTYPLYMVATAVAFTRIAGLAPAVPVGPPAGFTGPPLAPPPAPPATWR
jgi:hypothetical protein